MRLKRGERREEARDTDITDIRTLIVSEPLAYKVGMRIYICIYVRRVPIYRALHTGTLYIELYIQGPWIYVYIYICMYSARGHQQN